MNQKKLHPGTPLDHWIQRELRRNYNPTLDEAIPDNLLNLLDRGILDR